MRDEAELKFKFESTVAHVSVRKDVEPNANTAGRKGQWQLLSDGQNQVIS